jgi:hypothetical protein
LRIKASTSVLILLIVVDLVFIGLHLVYIQTDNLDSMYSLAKDRGYSEIYQYAKQAGIVLLLVILAWRRPAPVYGSWAVLFFYLLIDDAFLIHETYGLSVANALAINDSSGLRGRDFGELLITGIATILLFSAIAFAYLRSEPGERAFTRKLVAWLVVLAFFGVFVDMLHEVLIDTAAADALGILEDGGEIVVTSWIAWFVFGYTLKNH